MPWAIPPNGAVSFPWANKEITVKYQRQLAALSASAMFERMKTIVEAPGYKLLQGYKSDFYEHDRDTILSQYAPESTYLWVVRENGTHLNRLGVHSKSTEAAQASIHAGENGSSRGCEMYLLHADKVTRVTKEKAMAAMKIMQFLVNEDVVRQPNGEVLATYQVRTMTKQGDANQYASVVFQTSHLPRFGLSEFSALLTIALGETTVATGSLFARLEAATINGFDLCELIDECTKTPAQPVELALES